jgi:hypothetical protein
MGTEAARDVLLFGAEYKDDKITWLSASEDRRYYRLSSPLGPAREAAGMFF